MTDSDSYECPVEGCDYGKEEEKTLAQVRGHVNSNGDDDHVWQEAKHELLAEAEQREAAEAVDGESGDAVDEQQAEEGDPGEVPGPNGETGHLGTAEADDDQSDGDGEDSTEMATQEEYEEQYSDDADDPAEDEGGNSQPGDGDDGGDDRDGSGFSVPSVSTSTVVLVAGVAVAALLVWKLYSGGSAAGDYEPPEEQADTDDTNDDGGMAAIEAGTGGVQV